MPNEDNELTVEELRELDAVVCKHFGIPPCSEEDSEIVYPPVSSTWTGFGLVMDRLEEQQLEPVIEYEYPFYAIKFRGEYFGQGSANLPLALAFAVQDRIEEDKEKTLWSLPLTVYKVYAPDGALISSQDNWDAARASFYPGCELHEVTTVASTTTVVLLPK